MALITIDDAVRMAHATGAYATAGKRYLHFYVGAEDRPARSLGKVERDAHDSTKVSDLAVRNALAGRPDLRR